MLQEKGLRLAVFGCIDVVNFFRTKHTLCCYIQTRCSDQLWQTNIQNFIIKKIQKNSKIESFLSSKGVSQQYFWGDCLVMYHNKKRLGYFPNQCHWGFYDIPNSNNCCFSQLEPIKSQHTSLNIQYNERPFQMTQMAIILNLCQDQDCKL